MGFHCSAGVNDLQRFKFGTKRRVAGPFRSPPRIVTLQAHHFVMLARIIVTQFAPSSFFLFVWWG